MRPNRTEKNRLRVLFERWAEQDARKAAMTPEERLEERKASARAARAEYHRRLRESGTAEGLAELERELAFERTLPPEAWGRQFLAEDHLQTGAVDEMKARKGDD